MALTTKEGQDKNVEYLKEPTDKIINDFGDCLCGIVNFEMNPETLKIDNSTIKHYRCPIHSLQSEQRPKPK